MPRKKPTEDPMDPAAPLVIPDDQIPDFSVVERRIKFGDENVLAGTQTIELVNQPEPMYLRWGNMAMEGRNHYLQKAKGWVPVTTAELANALDAGDLGTSPEGYVVRGEKGREVLYKMPLRLYRQVEQRKAEDNLRKSRSAARMKDGARQAATQQADSGHYDARTSEALKRGSEHIGRMSVDLHESRETVDLER